MTIVWKAVGSCCGLLSSTDDVMDPTIARAPNSAAELPVVTNNLRKTTDTHISSPKVYKSSDEYFASETYAAARNNDPKTNEPPVRLGLFDPSAPTYTNDPRYNVPVNGRSVYNPISDQPNAAAASTGRYSSSYSSSHTSSSLKKHDSGIRQELFINGVSTTDPLGLERRFVPEKVRKWDNLLNPKVEYHADTRRGTFTANMAETPKINVPKMPKVSGGHVKAPKLHFGKKHKR